MYGTQNTTSMNKLNWKHGPQSSIYQKESSSSSRQPEVEPWPPLNDASKLAYLEILFPSFSLSRSPCYPFPNTILPGINNACSFISQIGNASLKRKMHNKVQFDLNRRSKSTSGVRNMGFAPAHSKTYWLFVQCIIWYES
jgi:hypothetical protein